MSKSLRLGFKVLSVKLCHIIISMKGVIAKKSLLSFHTTDGNILLPSSVYIHSFSRIPHFRILWMRSHGEAMEGFSHADQLFGQTNDNDTYKKPDVSYFSTELYCF